MDIKKEKCESLQQARDQIDQIDQTLVNLLSARQYYVDQAVRFKNTVQDVQAPERVEQVIHKVREQAEQAKIDADLVENIYRQMIQHFIQRELKEIRP